MLSDSIILIGTGVVGAMLGSAAVLADVSGVAAVLCGLVFALAALCLFAGLRFMSASPLARYRARHRPRDSRFE
jgi:hypothetical protein